MKEEAYKKKGEGTLTYYEPLDRANLSEDSDKSSPISKIQKPYSFARAKISFTLEDLENSN